MFNIGDAVVYSNAGLCTIDDIRTEDFLGDEQLFYVLSPKYSRGSTIFVAVGNSKVVLRHTVSKEKVSEVLSIEVEPEKEWIEKRQERHAHTTEVLKNCDIEETLITLRTLLCKRAEKEKMGKKLHMKDDSDIANLERMLFGEIAHVLDVSYDEVVQMFTTNI